MASTIECLRGAGIQVWMLTGDKVETATCIAISAGFKNRRQHFYFMKELTSQRDAELRIKEFELRSANTILMIDGHSLELFMKTPALE